MLVGGSHSRDGGACVDNVEMSEILRDLLDANGFDGDFARGMV